MSWKREASGLDPEAIHGRRQIGKSELVRQSIADRHDAVYYQAVQGTATTQLRRFVEAAATTYPDITDAVFSSELLSASKYFNRTAVSDSTIGRWCEQCCVFPLATQPDRHRRATPVETNIIKNMVQNSLLLIGNSVGSVADPKSASDNF
nr:hypothetical protein [Halorubrum sp. Atlit-28R]